MAFPCLARRRPYSELVEKAFVIGDWTRVRKDVLEHGDHAGGWHVARILVGADGDIASPEQIGDRRVAVGVPLDDVTPLAPDGARSSKTKRLSRCAWAKAVSDQSCHAMPPSAARAGGTPSRAKSVKLMIRSEELSMLSAAPLPGLRTGYGPRFSALKTAGRP
jgi:hypothetical protein